MRNRWWPWAGLLACLLATMLVSRDSLAGDSPGSPAPIHAVIYYSSAPWDGPSYEIVIPLIPMTAASADSAPGIRLEIWNNSEYDRAHTIQLLGKDSMKEGGSAIFREGPANALPQMLVGTVTFTRLKQKGPVTGSFDFATASGRKLRGRFSATWGNDPMRYTR